MSMWLSGWQNNWGNKPAGFKQRENIYVCIYIYIFVCGFFFKWAEAWEHFHTLPTPRGRPDKLPASVFQKTTHHFHVELQNHFLQVASPKDMVSLATLLPRRRLGQDGLMLQDDTDGPRFQRCCAGKGQERQKEDQLLLSLQTHILLYILQAVK